MVRKGCRLGLALLLSACGADTSVDSTGTSDGLPDGTWHVSSLATDEPVDLAAAAIRVQFVNVGASLRIDTDCHQLFGSYTFDDNGLASFTVPGVSTNDCNPADQAIENVLLEVIRSVRSWEGNPQELTLLGPTGRLELVLGD